MLDEISISTMSSAPKLEANAAVSPNSRAAQASSSSALHCSAAACTSARFSLMLTPTDLLPKTKPAHLTLLASGERVQESRNCPDSKSCFTRTQHKRHRVTTTTQHRVLKAMIHPRNN